jgi:hypothetical protein
LALALAACGGGEESSEAGQEVSRAASAAERVSLAGVCPARVVIQTACTPESTHGGLFQMLGRGFTIDAAKKRVVGKLVARGGVDTGVELELRAGGPAVGQQPIVSLLKQDPTITMAQNALEDGIGGASDLRTTAVFSPYAVDPVVFMWDKTKHPDFNVLQDIGSTDTKVVTFQTAQIDYLLGAGVFRPEQVDYSFNGSPERLAADRTGRWWSVGSSPTTLGPTPSSASRWSRRSSATPATRTTATSWSSAPRTRAGWTGACAGWCR